MGWAAKTAAKKRVKDTRPFRVQIAERFPWAVFYLDHVFIAYEEDIVEYGAASTGKKQFKKRSQGKKD